MLDRPAPKTPHPDPQVVDANPPTIMARALARLSLVPLLFALCAVAPGPTAAAGPDSALTIDGQYAATGRIRSQDTFNLIVAGRGGVPERNVGAVALNVTATAASRSSFLTIWPTGEPRPTASNLNFSPGQTVPNMVVAKVGDGGMVSIYNLGGSVDVVVDVLAWFPTTSGYSGLSPARLLDTRPGLSTVDGRYRGSGPVGSEETSELAVVGRGGVPANGVGGVVLNVAAVAPTAATFVTVWPTGFPRPTASNLNAEKGQVASNMVIAKVGAGGTVSLFNFSGSTDLVVDVLGWFPVEYSALAPLTPARLYDTRPGSATVDGRGAGEGPATGGSSFVIDIAGRGGVPIAGAAAVALNVTVTNPTSASYLTVWPGSGSRPTASNVNVVAGQTAANMVVVPLAPGGTASVYNFAGSADVVVDVLGWFPASNTFTAVVPARLLDTRGSVLRTYPPGDYFPTVGDIEPGRYATDVNGPPECQLTMTTSGSVPGSESPHFFDIGLSMYRITFLDGCGFLSSWVERPLPPPARPFIRDGIDGMECAAGTASVSITNGFRHNGAIVSTMVLPSFTYLLSGSGSRSFTLDGRSYVLTWVMEPAAPCRITLTP